MMLAFQHFQHAFAHHIRDPRRHPRPAGVPARRMAVYNELLYANLEGFLLACFPVTRRMLGERRWPRLVRAFFSAARCQTPYFRAIPREFLDWLNAHDALPGPAWLRELAHYEWAELAVDVMPAGIPGHDPRGDLLEGTPVLAPALMNLAYAWPVHRIGPEWRPRKPRATHLLVYRDVGDIVRFVALNPMAARLVALLQEGSATGRAACAALAAECGHPDPDALAGHAAALMDELRAAGAILGTRS